MDVVPPAEGDKREQALGAMAMPALANEQRGKHDAVLDFFIEKHQQDAELVIDTVVDLLKRRGLLSPDEFTSGLTESGYLAAWRRHVAGALDRSVEVGGAAGPPAPAVAPGEAATVTEDMLELPVAVAKSAQKALEKAKAEAAAMAGGSDGASTEIRVGTQCKHGGCNLAYSSQASLEAGKCIFHPGQPVFHEGYKYWSCCPGTKTTEFSDFMAFPGCQRGTCVFIEDEAAKKQKAKCRHDFYQVGSTASLSIYAKKTDPELCTFKASSHQLSLEIGYEAGTKSYSLDVRLFGPIDPTKSKVEIMGPKVELSLVKADGTEWERLGDFVENGESS